MTKINGNVDQLVNKQIDKGDTIYVLTWFKPGAISYAEPKGMSDIMLHVISLVVEKIEMDEENWIIYAEKGIEEKANVTDGIDFVTIKREEINENRRTLVTTSETEVDNKILNILRQDIYKR